MYKSYMHYFLTNTRSENRLRQACLDSVEQRIDGRCCFVRSGELNQELP
jgi:hypothetical protein